MAAVATLVCETISYLIQIILFGISIQILAFLKILAIEILYNTLIIIIIYPLIQKTGVLLERIFNEKSILTRYY